MLESYPDILTMKELQEALSIGKTTAYDLIRKNVIPSFKLGRSIRIPKKELEKVLQNQVNMCYNARCSSIAKMGCLEGV